VLRELEEETGFVGEVERLVDVDDRLFTSRSGAGRMHAIRIVYAVNIVGGSLRDELDGSTDTCRWVAPEEALRLRLGELARHALERVTPVDA
jgi:ADP-ribose pyrophosphatase YjhB (NUDIX family)